MRIRKHFTRTTDLVEMAGVRISGGGRFMNWWRWQIWELVEMAGVRISGGGNCWRWQMYEIVEMADVRISGDGRCGN